MDLFNDLLNLAVGSLTEIDPDELVHHCLLQHNQIHRETGCFNSPYFCMWMWYAVYQGPLQKIARNLCIHWVDCYIYILFDIPLHHHGHARPQSCHCTEQIYWHS